MSYLKILFLRDTFLLPASGRLLWNARRT